VLTCVRVTPGAGLGVSSLATPMMAACRRERHSSDSTNTARIIRTLVVARVRPGRHRFAESCSSGRTEAVRGLGSGPTELSETGKRPNCWRTAADASLSSCKIATGLPVAWIRKPYAGPTADRAPTDPDSVSFPPPYPNTWQVQQVPYCWSRHGGGAAPALRSMNSARDQCSPFSPDPGPTR
jgi:hypothetical protein